ncbi:MAG: hypothetical protein KDA90_03985 [Planctomycetaceae bacterium]|nr:hypothetical protein [Planctomycetaceae bacterium]
MKTMSELLTKPLMVMAAGLTMCLAVSVVLADEAPEPDSAAVEVSDFDGGEDEPDAAAFSTDPNAPQAAALKIRKPKGPPLAGYYSDTLKGEFLAQWMKITDARGKVYLFWGARILSLDPNSPLKTISLRAGDVVTRLDGDPIWIGMTRKNRKAPYQLVEMENHYGPTAVRFIFKSTQQVQELNVNLGPQGGGGGRLPAPIAP